MCNPLRGVLSQGVSGLIASLAVLAVALPLHYGTGLDTGNTAPVTTWLIPHLALGMGWPIVWSVLITRLDTRCRGLLMGGGVWVLALLYSPTPLLGWGLFGLGMRGASPAANLLRTPPPTSWLVFTGALHLIYGLLAVLGSSVLSRDRDGQ